MFHTVIRTFDIRPYSHFIIYPTVIYLREANAKSAADGRAAACQIRYCLQSDIRRIGDFFFFCLLSLAVVTLLRRRSHVEFSRLVSCHYRFASIFDVSASCREMDPERDNRRERRAYRCNPSLVSLRNRKRTCFPRSLTRVYLHNPVSTRTTLRPPRPSTRRTTGRHNR